MKAFERKSPLQLSRRAARRIGVYLVVGAFLAFCLAWWNRSLSPALSGDIFYAFAWRHGLMPYRDYYFAAPPGMFLLSVGIADLLGNHLIALWAVGLALRAAAVAVLFLWMRRIFHPAIAAVAVLVAAIASCGDVADSPYFYNHIAVAFLTFGAAAAAVSLSRRHGRQTFIWAAAAGVSMGIAALIKQTTALGIAAVAGWSFIALLRTRGARNAVAWAGAVVAGWILPWLAAVAWLRRAGVLGVFFDSAFVNGPKAKGSILATLLRPIGLTLEYPDLHPAAILAVGTLVVAAFWRSRTLRRGLARTAPLLPLALIGIAAWAAVLGLLGPDRRRLALAACYVTLAGNLGLVVLAIPSLKSPSRRSMQIGLLASLGFGAAYSLSISWPAFEVMIFPGLALVVARALESAPAGEGRRELRAIAFAACAALVVAVSSWKMRHPQAFMAWEEPPIWASGTEPASDALAGFVLSQSTASFYDETSRLIAENSLPGERVFTYPGFPALYVLADRLPATYAVSHFLDVCPDWIAAADADRILRAPPAVVVFEKLDEEFYADQERWFRGGRSSGNRVLLRALETLKPRYRVLGEAAAGPRTHAPIEVWVLRR